MYFNLALLLVILTAVSGFVWLIDHLFFFPKRRRRAQAIETLGGLDAEERTARATKVMNEPVAVEYARSFFPVLLLILIFRSFIAEPFKIPSGSMMPTLMVGDFILVSKFSYGVRLPVLNTRILATGEPKRGDVFVFRFPEDPSQDYIKRVIGLPGDEISYRNKTLFVNGEQVPNKYFGPYTGPSEPSGRDMSGAQEQIESLPNSVAAGNDKSPNPTIDHHILLMADVLSGREGSWHVPEGHYFAMGDNRDNSLDSRFWGFVPEENLVGRAFLIWMNWSGGIDFGRIGTIIK